MSQRNPYSPPAAAVADHQAPLGEDRVVPNGRVRPLHHGWKWIAGGWELFKRQPGMWILTVLLFYGALILVSLIPFANFLTSIVWPIFTAGFFAMAHIGYRGERFKISDVLSGFEKKPGTLALIGATYLASILGIVLIFMVFGGVQWFSMAAGNPDPAAFVGLGIAIAIYSVIVMAIGMAIAFAPALVQLNGLSALQAMKMSAMGCLKNVLPGTLFAILLMLLVIVSVIPLGLGLLITIPMITTTFYVAYRDIFVESQPA